MKLEKILEQEVKVSYQDRLLHQRSTGLQHLPLPLQLAQPQQVQPQQVPLQQVPLQQVPLQQPLRRQNPLQRQQKPHQLTVQHVPASEAE